MGVVSQLSLLSHPVLSCFPSCLLHCAGIMKNIFVRYVCMQCHSMCACPAPIKGVGLYIVMLD